MLSGLIGAAIPSRDKVQRSRWRFTDPAGVVIAPPNWPSAAALRGHVNLAGQVGRYRDGDELLIRVTSVPTFSASSDIAAVTFMQRIDSAGRSADGSHADLEHRFIEALVKAIAADSKI